MSTHVSKLMSMLAAQTIRNGGEFAAPTYEEEDICMGLQAEADEE